MSSENTKTLSYVCFSKHFNEKKIVFSNKIYSFFFWRNYSEVKLVCFYIDFFPKKKFSFSYLIFTHYKHLVTDERLSKNRFRLLQSEVSEVMRTN